MSTPLRALVGARVSSYRDDSKVSHTAQLGTGSDWVTKHGHEVTATFEDLDISADKYSPFERPDLGPWLSDEKSFGWDILVFSKVDRAFRSIRDTVDLARWIEKHKKILVFAEDNLVLNFRDDVDSFERMMAEFFIMVASFFAQMELNRFKSRAKDFHRVIRQTSRWAYGTPPLGFTTSPNPDGNGRCLVQDAEGQDILRSIATRLNDGWSWNRIANRMNEDKVPTNQDRSRMARGLDPLTNPWAPTQLIHVMTSLATQGIKIDSDGNPILTANGEMIQVTSQSFTDDEWDQIQAEVTKRRLSGKRRTFSSNPLLGVGECPNGHSLAQKFDTKPSGKVYRYYRCSNARKRCPGINYVADDADALLEGLFLDRWGDMQREERVFIPGSDNRPELERVKAAITRLRAESDAGLIDDEAEYMSRLTGLTARRKLLESSPVTEPRWELVGMGETFADAWNRSSPEERRQLLIARGIRFVVHSRYHAELVTPD